METPVKAVTKFPVTAGLTLDLVAPQDGSKVGVLHLVEVDPSGAVIQALLEIRPSGGHVEFERLALADTDGYEVDVDQATNLSKVAIR